MPRILLSVVNPETYEDLSGAGCLANSGDLVAATPRFRRALHVAFVDCKDEETNLEAVIEYEYAKANFATHVSHLKENKIYIILFF